MTGFCNSQVLLLHFKFDQTKVKKSILINTFLWNTVPKWYVGSSDRSVGVHRLENHWSEVEGEQRKKDFPSYNKHCQKEKK